jgi:hypothetical protein
MQHIVINTCYGGFNLSREAYRYIARRLGRPVYFFTHQGSGPYAPDDGKSSFFVALDVKHPNRVLREMVDPSIWEGLTLEERQAANLKHERHHIPNFDGARDCPLLVEVVRKLRRRASHSYARLKIVRVPNAVEWHVSEYDGLEHVCQNHQTWY